MLGLAEERPNATYITENEWVTRISKNQSRASRQCEGAVACNLL